MAPTLSRTESNRAAASAKTIQASFNKLRDAGGEVSNKVAALTERTATFEDTMHEAVASVANIRSTLVSNIGTEVAQLRANRRTSLIVMQNEKLLDSMPDDMHGEGGYSIHVKQF